MKSSIMKNRFTESFIYRFMIIYFLKILFYVLVNIDYLNWI